LGGNNIAYNAAGDFFVANSSRTILRFPAEGGPSQVYGDLSSGVRSAGPIAIAPNGDLYYAVPNSSFFRQILRFTAAGQSEVFDTLPQGNLTSLAVDSAGNVFAATVYGLFRYDHGDPASRRLLSAVGRYPDMSIALSPDESEVYMDDAGSVYAIGAESGNVDMLAPFVGDQGFASGPGIAVALPEPVVLCMLAVASFASAVMRRGPL
jgi:DNA-binding beta-propeller fold protein YncE